MRISQNFASGDIKIAIREIIEDVASILKEDANKMLKDVKVDANMTLFYSNLGTTNWRDVAAVAWSDAAKGNRPKGFSTGGLCCSGGGCKN